MNQLPPGWALVHIDDIKANSPNALAIGPFGSNLKVSDYRDAGVPLVFVRNIRAYAFDSGDLKFVSTAKAESLRPHHVRRGDLLITKMGDPPGDVAIYPLPEEGIITADCIKMTPHPSVNVRYLLHALSMPTVKRQIIQITQGVAQPKMSLARFRHGIQLPLAPSAEQERIVAAIEEQFSRLDAGVAALDRVRSNLKQLRDLLPLLLLAGVGSAVGRLGVESDDCVDDGPHRWVHLAEVSQHVVDCEHWTPKYLPEGMPCIDTTCIAAGVIHRDRLRYVDPATHQSRVRRLAPQHGDLIFAREGTVGTAVVVPRDLHPCLGQRVMLFRPNPEIVDSDYMCLVVNSQIVKRQYRPMLLGTTVPHLNVRDAKALRIPLPALAVQHAIAAEADRIGSVLSAVEAAVEFNAGRSSALRSSILAAAFSGKLVSQDPDDEAASALLERIAAERATSNRHQSARSRKSRTPQEKVRA